MGERPLIETNPFLREREKFRKALVINVASSTAIETGEPVESIARMLLDGTTQPIISKPRGFAR